MAKIKVRNMAGCSCYIAMSHSLNIDKYLKKGDIDAALDEANAVIDNIEIAISEADRTKKLLLAYKEK